jgi:hypothetical protein
MSEVTRTAIVQSKSPPFYGRRATESLHTLKDKWGCQATYLEEQCTELLAHLDAAIEATRLASPVRSQRQPFNPDGSQRNRRAADRINASNEERLLEARIWSRNRFDAPRSDDEPRLWATLVGIQVPLFDSRKKRGWGHIDLLGIDHAGAPVVVELKRGNSSEVPLRPVLEVVSYAIALRENWPRFAEQLCEQFKKIGKPYTPASGDAPFSCVVLAPSLYWEAWAPGGRLGKAVSAGSLAGFKKLLSAFAERGYPVTAGSVSDISTEICSFPTERA